MVRLRLVVGTEIKLRGRQAAGLEAPLPLVRVRVTLTLNLNPNPNQLRAWCATRDFSSRNVLNLAPQMELLLGAKASSRYLPKRDELLLRRRAA